MGSGDLEGLIMRHGGDVEALIGLQAVCEQAGIAWDELLSRSLAALVPVLSAMLARKGASAAGTVVAPVPGDERTTEVARISNTVELTPGPYAIVLPGGVQIGTLCVQQSMQPGGQYPVLGVAVP